MYDELIVRLREKAGAFDYDGRPDIACDYEQAANVIEELAAIREEQKAQIIIMAGEIEELKDAVESYRYRMAYVPQPPKEEKIS